MSWKLENWLIKGLMDVIRNALGQFIHWRKHVPKISYQVFQEDMLKHKIFDVEGFKKRYGYTPTEKQQTLLLARERRENWKGHYRKVIRDKRGRFVTWKKWRRRS